MARLIGHFEPGSIPWHKARAGGLGGSEIAAVVGLSPFESRFSLWHRKAGEVGQQDLGPEVEWGTRLEGAVIAKWLDEHPEYRDEGSGTFCHNERPWQIANPDRLVYRHLCRVDELDHTVVLEVKTSPFGDGWGEEGTDQIPPHVRAQCIWYADVFGSDRAHIAVLIGGFDYREYTIDVDPAEAEHLRDEGRAFLDSINAGQRPDIDEHSATYWAVRELHPEINGEDVEVGDHVAEPYIDARTLLATAVENERRAKAMLADAMGDAGRAMWRGQCIARRQARGDGTPYVVAAKNLPTIERT